MPQLDHLVGMLRAVSEHTRLRMLALMAEGELSVKDITDILEQSQPRVSRHLRLLAEAGLASRNAEGAWAYYRLSDDAVAAALVAGVLAQLDAADPVLRADREKLAVVRAEQARAAAAYFATVADSWDALRGMHVAESAIEAAILEVTAGRSYEKVLDFGTGTGRMLELLADRYRLGVGLDSSREMIAVARAKMAAAGIAHAQIRFADISTPVETAGTADLVVLHQVLHYFDDPGRVLAEAARALTPEGQVLVVDFAPHEHEFLRSEQAHRRLGLSQAQMTSWARQVGLRVLSVREFANPDAPHGLTVCLWVLAKTTKRKSVDDAE